VKKVEERKIERGIIKPVGEEQCAEMGEEYEEDQKIDSVAGVFSRPVSEPID
jgi:hypothetical protein